MPFMKDLSQMERSYGGKPKMVKKLTKVRLPLSIAGDQTPKMNEMIVTVIVGPVKGFENTEHTKEITVEAQKGGIYRQVGDNLEEKIKKAFASRKT